jgi:hypothetical protein
VEGDLAWGAARALASAPLEALGAGALDPALREVATDFGTVGVLALVLGAAAPGAARLDRWLDEAAAAGPGRWLRRGVLCTALAAAAGLWLWMVRHPAPELVLLAARADHVAFALLAGLALRRAPEPLRLACLAALSLGFVGQYVGWRALGVVLGACLAGFALTHAAAARGPARAALAHGALVAAVFAWLGWIRGDDPATSLGGVGLFVFVALRHVSFVAESCRGATRDVGVAGYLCFLLFYPTCVGAAEVFREFREQNLRGPAPVDVRRAAAAVVRGLLLAVVGAHVPIDEALMTASVGFAALWANVLLLYLRAACFMMGAWGVAEASASLLGVRLRPNFRGVLRARNPAQFWRA